MPKKDKLVIPCRFSLEVLEMLVNEDDHTLNVL